MEMEVDKRGRSYERTLEDVKVVISHAKLDEKELLPTSQVIYVADKLKDYTLLEMNNDILASLKVGEEVGFYGEEASGAVLCTKDRTFEVKEAEVSNSLLLTPNLKLPSDLSPSTTSERQLLPLEVEGIYYKYLEVKEIKPRVRKVREALKARALYKGPEHEDEAVPVGMTTQDLLHIASMSPDQLKNALQEIGAFQVEDRWRMLEFDYEFRAVSLLLDLVDTNSWPLDQIPFGETMETLGDLLPKPVLHHILQRYLKPSEQLSDEGEELFKLEDRRVARFLAEVLLRPVDKFVLSDFLDAWDLSVPQGVSTQLEDLGGLALWDMDAHPPVIWHFPEEDLPEDLALRFQALFNARPKWSLAQITPYLERLATGKQTVNAILTKHSRGSNINGVRYYCARHAN